MTGYRVRMCLGEDKKTSWGVLFFIIIIIFFLLGKRALRKRRAAGLVAGGEFSSSYSHQDGGHVGFDLIKAQFQF